MHFTHAVHIIMIETHIARHNVTSHTSRVGREVRAVFTKENVDRDLFVKF